MPRPDFKNLSSELLVSELGCLEQQDQYGKVIVMDHMKKLERKGSPYFWSIRDFDPPIFRELPDDPTASVLSRECGPSATIPSPERFLYSTVRAANRVCALITARLDADEPNYVWNDDSGICMLNDALGTCFLLERSDNPEVTSRIDGVIVNGERQLSKQGLHLELHLVVCLAHCIEPSAEDGELLLPGEDLYKLRSRREADPHNWPDLYAANVLVRKVEYYEQPSKVFVTKKQKTSSSGGELDAGPGIEERGPLKTQLIFMAFSAPRDNHNEQHVSKEVPVKNAVFKFRSKVAGSPAHHKPMHLQSVWYPEILY